jgi:dihydrofolate reductase
MGRVRVYIASSVDGFVAGVDDDLSWLPTEGPGDPGDALTYEAFTAQVGVLLMGRRTFDVVAGFEGAWPYDKPVLVATHRPLPANAPAGVRAVSGTIGEVVAVAQQAAGEADVYLDGGALIRSALDAGLIDELVVTMVPTVLGAGVPLFAGTERRHALQLVGVHRYGEQMVQLVLRP